MASRARIERLPAEDLVRLTEIDRAEHVTIGYRQEGRRLIEESVDWRVPDFFHEGNGDHSVAGIVDVWGPFLGDGDGILLGAFDDDRLAGLAMLRTAVRPGLAQVALLFVDRDHRRRGIAGDLMDEMLRLARDADAHAVYVSATPSDSAVGFYRSRGFAPTGDPLPELLEKEPEDIHMILALG